MGNCLQQPGQPRNQLKKSMRETTSPPIKLSVPWLLLLPRQSQ